jgi:hypothetical protein
MSDWYYKHRERILEEKRKQYATDTTFREKKKEKTLDHYHKQKKEKKEQMIQNN